MDPRPQPLYSPRAGGFAPVVGEPRTGRWGLQVAPSESVRFARRLDQVIGASWVTGDTQLLPNEETPLGDVVVLSNVDLSKCYVELDIVELSVTGGRQHHVLGTVLRPNV